MGLMDAITAEDRVQLKVSDLETLMKNAAKADLIFNGKCRGVLWGILR